MVIIYHGLTRGGGTKAVSAKKTPSLFTYKIHSFEVQERSPPVGCFLMLRYTDAICVKISLFSEHVLPYY